MSTNVHAFTGSMEIRFAKEIKKGDTLTFYRIGDTSDGCRASGSATVTLLGNGIPDQPLGAIPSNGRITIPE